MYCDQNIEIYMIYWSVAESVCAMCVYVYKTYVLIHTYCAHTYVSYTYILMFQSRYIYIFLMLALKSKYF